jgi:hypothetical protein
MKRRSFIKSSVFASSCMLVFPSVVHSIGLSKNITNHDKITGLATSLLKKWCVGLYANQTNKPGDKVADGGIYSPGDQAYLGRCADAIYPFLWMARHTNDEKYIVAAKKVYAWEQNNCWTEKYGCWFDPPGKPDGWKSISVFSAITKMEAIEHYPDLLGEETIREWKKRLRRVAEYIYKTFHVEHANINYPATATFALFKLGEMFNEDKYIAKAAKIADGIMSYFTPEGFFYGEGGRHVNKDGQYPIDLGYNVEESLPALAHYSRLSGNKELHEKVLKAMKVHLEFMLPSGGWDNSWGTRNFKWTMWGSRTSDGCHAGYYLFADKEPVFAEAVYRNLKCLEACTHNNILTSGPNEYLAKATPSTYHTFDHAKALTTLLNMTPPEISQPQTILPREKEYGVKKYDDINTILFSKGPWRGTVTGYNVDYYNKTNGHCSGGALSCLYHTRLGMLSAASMTEYRRWEKYNMLDEKSIENFMCLTPRLELVIEGKPVYRNISDYQAEIEFHETQEELLINTKSRLVSGKQNIPEAGSPVVSVNYKITGSSIAITIGINKKIEQGDLTFIFPLVCSSVDHVTLNGNSANLKNRHGTLAVESNYLLTSPISIEKRVYNFIPGLQAYPIEIDCSELQEKKLSLLLS